MEHSSLDDCNVFVKYLPPELTEGEFHKMFKGFGSVISSKIMVDQSGKSLGYGFVRFSSAEIAQKAISAMNGRKVANKRLLCKLANQSPSSSLGSEYRNPLLRQQLPSDNVYIKPLLLETTEDDLIKLFAHCGKIIECKVMVDKNTGISHQIGFVRFETTDQAKAAISTMTGHKLHQNATPLVVKFADTKEQKDARKSLRQQSSSLDDYEAGGYSPVYYYSPSYPYTYPGMVYDDSNNGYTNSPHSYDYAAVGSYPGQQFYMPPPTYYYEGVPVVYSPYSAEYAGSYGGEYEDGAGPVYYANGRGGEGSEYDQTETDAAGNDDKDVKDPEEDGEPQVGSPMTPSTPININYEKTFEMD